MTMYRSAPAAPTPSVLNSTNTVTGYVEFSYWLEYYCNPANQGAMSDNNWAIFKDVKMFNSKTDTTIATNPYVNMEYLFNMTGATPDDDPAETSLFNLTTLKTLVSLG